MNMRGEPKENVIIECYLLSGTGCAALAPRNPETEAIG